MANMALCVELSVSFARRLRERSLEAFPGLGEEVVGGSLIWWNIVAFLLVVLATGIVHLVLHGLIRRKLRRDASTGGDEPRHEQEARRWHDLLLEAALPPLAVLVWAYGLYLAFSFLFWFLRTREETPLTLLALDWVWDAGFLILLIWFLFRAIGAIDSTLRQRASKAGTKWDRILAPLVGRTLRLVLPAVAVILALPLLPITTEALSLFRTALSIVIILFVAVVFFQAVRAVEEGVIAGFPVDVADNLQARKLRTQVTVLKKVAFVVISLFALTSILMVFEPLRQFGMSILASAGIAGIIIGFAAQRSLTTLLAGFQIAITQPIRLDDVVIVEGEWGRIEEITLTYVVVRIWDLRRLVLPIDYFITKPFQNWTRTSADILGSVFLQMDYSVPVGELRKELDRILEKSPKWDKKVKVLQVTEAKERTLELRALVGAADAGAAWELRCDVREKMIEFIRDNYPESLPRFRAEVSSPGEAGDPGLLPGKED